MKKSLLTILVLIGLTFFLNCTTRKIYEPNSLEIRSGLSLEEISERVMLSVKGQGWEYELLKPGAVIATWKYKNQNRLIVVLEINYDTNHIQIKYRDSRGLSYDGTRIHRRYNFEVIQLEESLKRSLGSTNSNGP